MVQILEERKDSLVRLTRAERGSERQLRAALIRVGGYLGLDERTVIRCSEIITGRAWSRCGAAQVVEVGKCLLDIALALKGEHSRRWEQRAAQRRSVCRCRRLPR